jgi:hypothetical protein
MQNGGINMKIIVTKNESWNWYQAGEIYTVKDPDKYGSLGLQVFNGQEGVSPDVVAHGHYETVQETHD